jgi:hypothetical protein
MKAWLTACIVAATSSVFLACHDIPRSPTITVVEVGDLRMNASAVTGPWTQAHRPPPKEAGYCMLDFPRTQESWRVGPILINAQQLRPPELAAKQADETLRKDGHEYYGRLSNAPFGSVILLCGSDIEYKPDGRGKRTCSMGGYITSHDHFYNEWYGPPDENDIIKVGHQVLEYVKTEIKIKTVAQE